METEDGTAPVSVWSEFQKPDRRKRLVPVAAMMAIAVVVIAVMRWPL
jgi:ACR3 family arsenite efflux pump ArsB